MAQVRFFAYESADQVPPNTGGFSLCAKLGWYIFFQSSKLSKNSTEYNKANPSPKLYLCICVSLGV